jgi:hypothetical protein
MSIHRNRQKLNQAVNGKEYKILILKYYYPIFWDEYIVFYPKYRRGFKNANKGIQSYQVRRYRTWKYNRKTQYKT